MGGGEEAGESDEDLRGGDWTGVGNMKNARGKGLEQKVGRRMS